MYRYRSPLPPALCVPHARSPRSLRPRRSVQRLPSLDPSPREIYGERELLLEEQFTLIHEIESLTSEVSFLRACYDRVLAEHNDREEYEINLSRKMNDLEESEAQAKAHSFTTRQTELQREDEEVDDQLAYLSKFFGSESLEQIRTEVGVEKTVITRVKSELSSLVDTQKEIEAKLHEEELNERINQFSDNKSQLDGLNQELAESTEQYDKHQKSLDEAMKKVDQYDEELTSVENDLASIRGQKYAKQKQLANLAQTLRAEERGKVKKRAFAMLAQKTVYEFERFHKNLHDIHKVESNEPP
jgi:chromosome segregation ATPase